MFQKFNKWKYYKIVLYVLALLLFNKTNTFSINLNKIKSINDSSIINSSLDSISKSDFSKNSYIELNQLLLASKKTDYKLGIAHCLRLLGKYELTQNNRLDKAAEYLISSLALYETLKDNEGIASSNLQLGIISYDLQNYHEAINYFENVLKKSKTNNTIRATANYLSALSYSEIDSFSKAINLFDYAIKEYTKLNYEDGIRMCKQFIGKMYINNKMYSKAILYLNKLVQNAKSSKDSLNNVPAYAFLSIAYTKVQDYQNAIKFGEYAYKYGASASGASYYIKETYNSLHTSYSKTGNLNKAYFYLSQLNNMKDSLYNNSIIEDLSKTKSKYEYEQQLKIEKIEREKKELIAQQELRRQKFLRNSFIIGFFVVLVFSVTILYQIRKVNKAKKQSDELLLNILPYDVAEELKAKGKAEAKLFEEVSVLFTDFKGFTEISQNLSATELVAEINECFTEFDRIMKRHHIEKIKTIGDSYMAVSGLPISNNDHAINAVNAAREILLFINNLNKEKEKRNKAKFEIRIGIHCGPVVAGIVGLNKFSYDIWGDTVNTASRMEQSAEVGKINISKNLYELVKSNYQCNYRGKISVKGKGEIEMYYIEV